MSHCFSIRCLRGSSAVERRAALADTSKLGSQAGQSFFNEKGCECDCGACLDCKVHANRSSERDIYMVNVNGHSGSVFVKVLEFFRSQGGFRDDWGKHWVPLVATGIEDAREKGCQLPGARPYAMQAKP
jgi:hypothetical protein